MGGYKEVTPEDLRSFQHHGRKTAKIFAGLQTGGEKLFTASDFDALYEPLAGSNLYKILSHARENSPPGKKSAMVWQGSYLPLDNASLNTPEAIDSFLKDQQDLMKQVEAYIGQSKFEKERAKILSGIEFAPLTITDQTLWDQFTASAQPETVRWATTIARLIEKATDGKKRPNLSHSFSRAHYYAGTLSDKEEAIAYDALAASWKYGKILEERNIIPQENIRDRMKAGPLIW